MNFLDFKDHTINFFHKNKIIKLYDIQYNQLQQLQQQQQFTNTNYGIVSSF